MQIHLQTARDFDKNTIYTAAGKERAKRGFAVALQNGKACPRACRDMPAPYVFACALENLKTCNKKPFLPTPERFKNATRPVSRVLS